MQRLAENSYFVVALTPASRNAGAATSAAIDTSGYDGLTVLVHAGTLGASATLDCKVTECDTSGGSYTDVTNAAITQLVKATDDDKVAAIDVRLGDRANRKRYVKIVLTVGTAASVCGATAILYQPEKLPVTNAPAAVLV